jgi:Nuclear pore complex scaffold, nucleoporins 186/192/205
MAVDSLDALEALHRDLEALKENRMPNIDRLAAELEAHVDEFRNLLDQKRRSSESRRKLCQSTFSSAFTLFYCFRC